MAASLGGQVPSELVEEWSQYLDSSQRDQFRQSFAEATMQTIDSTLQPFFATWRTTLMGTSLAKLMAIASDDRLGPLVTTLVVQDDCESVDPWTSSEIPSPDSTYDIWPRNDAGTADTDEVGIADLAAIIREGRLRPDTIRIRDYRIAKGNLDFCPETIYVRDTYNDIATSSQGSTSVAALLRRLIEDSALAPSSLVIRYSFLHEAATNFSRHARFAFDPARPPISSPSIYDAILTLSPAVHRGQGDDGCNFSLLRSCEIDLAGHDASTFWLPQILTQASQLETLTLQLRDPGVLPAIRPVTRLRAFTMNHTTAVSADAIQAILSGSSDSLLNLTLEQVELTPGSEWREFLAALGRSCTGMLSFRISVLREGGSRTLPLDFRALDAADLHEECRKGLRAVVKRYPSGGKRVPALEYKGPRAGEVLGIAAGKVISRIPIE